MREFAAVADAASAPTSLPALQAAVDLYTADFLAGFTLPDSPDFDDWQAYTTEQLRRRARTLLEKLAWAYAAAGEGERAIATAHRRLALDPLDEDAHRALMQFYAQSGQPGAALRQYEQCRQILEDELGAPPAAETTALYERIRRAETGRQSGDARRVISPLTIDNSPLTIHRLPTQATPFVGRLQELAELTRLLADPHIRLVTILAPGGMGKSRLGLAAAGRQVDQFADGVFFVTMAPLTSADAIVTAIAEQAGFSFSGAAPPRAQLLDYFRDRQVLLLLDNFEHLLAGAPLVSELLRAAPAVKVLVTSREKLNLAGETVYLLSGLHFPTQDPPEDLLAYDAVRLFVQSARRIDIDPSID